MATFQIFTTYDMANPIGMQADAIRGDVTLNSATGFTLAYNLASGHWVTTFTGTGYTYAQGNGQVQVTGGTINSEVANNGTQDVFSLTGASVDVIADGSLSSGAAELNLWLQGGGTIIGSSDRQSFVDYTGNHTITGGGGGDRVVFSGAQANYTITPTATGYTVKDNVGSGGTDTLNGIAYLKFSDGYYLSAPPAQSITGGLADETLSGGFGNDTINGGGGSDTVAFSGIYSNYTITHNVASNTYVVQDSTGFDGTYTLTNISYMRFTDQTLSFVGQTITETTPDDSVQTGHGDDTISGVGGHNTVVYSGPSANYTITASGLSYVVRDDIGLDGTDTLTNISTLQFTDKVVALPLTLTGGQGNDVAYTGPGNDTLDGGGGIDTAVYYGNSGSFTVAQQADGSLKVTDNTGAEGIDTLRNVENIQFADQTVSLVGQTITETTPDDSVQTGHGNDTISGVGGRDTVVYSGPSANYTITASGLSYVVRDNIGLDGTDTLTNISMLQFTDKVVALPLTLTGGQGNDVAYTGPGNDTLDGGGGIDTAVYYGNSGSFTVAQQADGSLKVTDNTGAEGIDTLRNVENIQFADQTVSFVGQTITETTPNDTQPTGHGNDTISGVGGHNTVVYSGPSANYTITASGLSYVVSDNVGLDGTDTLTNISTLQFTDKNIALPLTLTGGQGNDTAYTGPGNDTMDGGGGIDTAVFYGSRSNFTIAQHADGSLTVTDTTGAEGVDTLSNVERLQFDNGKVAFDMNGSAGITAKLIGAAFGLSNLQPALSGEGIGIFDLGYTLEQIAQPAINTTLFQTLAGSNSNLAFVTLVYHNVLGTGNASETDDIAYFVSLLDQHVLTQAELLVKATNCTENVQNVNLVGLATTGLEYV